MALIKCTKCGQMISDKAISCPNCGNPIVSKLHGNGTSTNGVKAGKSLITISLITMCFIVIGGLLSYFSMTKSDYNMVEEMQQEKTLENKIKEAKNIEEVKKLIDGTTWHYTENLSSSAIGSWIKVTFSNGMFTAYYALPSDGQWTKGGSGEYEIVDGRYANTGDKYLSVAWEDKMKLEGWLTTPCQFMLTLDNFQLHVGSKFMDGLAAANSFLEHGNSYNIPEKMNLTGKMEFGDYTWN